MTSFFSASAVVLASLVSLLAHSTVRGVRCHSSSSGLLRHPNAALLTCGSRFISCHEHFHALKDSKTIVYQSGCGPHYMDLEMQLIAGLGLAEEKTTECFTDGCNRDLMLELESSHRVCYSANREVSFNSTAIACEKNETKCYQDTMDGAKDPLYFAGCGTCPSYTLYCSTCSENYCNASAVSRRRVIYVNPAGSDDWLYHIEDAAVSVHRSCLATATLGLPVLALALTRTL